MRRKLMVPMTAIALGSAMLIGQFAAAQTADRKTHRNGEHIMRYSRIAKQLELTPDQVRQAKEIAQETHRKAVQVFTPEQQKAMEQKHQARTDRRQSYKGFAGLTEDQKAQINKIREDARAQIQAVRDDSSLTAEARKAKMIEIRQSVRQQIESVLTPEQKAGFAAKRAPQRKEGFVPGINLTEAQRAKIKAIHEDAKTRFRSILTPEQKQKLDETAAQSGSYKCRVK